MTIPTELEKMIEAAPPPAVDVEAAARLRERVRELRDATVEVADLERRLSDAKEVVTRLRTKDVPDAFDAARSDYESLPPEGNTPGYDVTLENFYQANISAEWEPERRERAFSWLAGNGHGGLIKRSFTITFDRSDQEGADRFRRSLVKAGIAYVEQMSVPWNTLTAWLKEQVAVYSNPVPLDLLGATVGRVAKMKERKEGAAPKRGRR